MLDVAQAFAATSKTTESVLVEEGVVALMHRATRSRVRVTTGIRFQFKEDGRRVVLTELGLSTQGSAAYASPINAHIRTTPTPRIRVADQVASKLGVTWDHFIPHLTLDTKGWGPATRIVSVTTSGSFASSSRWPTCGSFCAASAFSDRPAPCRPPLVRPEQTVGKARSVHAAVTPTLPCLTDTLGARHVGKASRPHEAGEAWDERHRRRRDMVPAMRAGQLHLVGSLPTYHTGCCRRCVSGRGGDAGSMILQASRYSSPRTHPPNSIRRARWARRAATMWRRQRHCGAAARRTRRRGADVAA